MHKKVRKLELGKETLLRLEAGSTSPAVGGVFTDTCTQFESCGRTCATRCSYCCL
jgi:hypothetical protein